jgi:hypothetical protein
MTAETWKQCEPAVDEKFHRPIKEVRQRYRCDTHKMPCDNCQCFKQKGWTT